MATPTYTPLASITIANTTTASVTFSGFSSTLYKDLILIGSAGNLNNPTFEKFRVHLNGDTTANYDMTWVMTDTGSATTSAGGWTSDTSITADFNGTSTSDAITHINFMDFAATDKTKTMLIRADAATGGTSLLLGRWKSTAAITSIRVKPNGTNFTSGSTFALYGIAG